MNKNFNFYQKHLKYVLKTICLIWIINLSVSQTLSAQNPQRMLIFQIEGNQYVRKSYDKMGQIKGSQKFEIGQVKKVATGFSLPLKAISYDENGMVKDSASTEYRCTPNEESVLVYIFPYSIFSSDKVVTAKLNKRQIIYPSNWEVNQRLPSFSFELSIEGGLSGAIGSNTMVSVSERVVTESDAKKATYKLTSFVEISIYLLGVKVETLIYDVEEIINTDIGIVDQTFRKSTGEYFTIKLTNK